LLEELKDGERGNRRFTWEDLADESVFTDNWQVTWEGSAGSASCPPQATVTRVEYATSFVQGGQETLNHWGVKRTGADYRAKHWTPAESDQTTDVEAWLEGEKEFELEPSGEEFLDTRGTHR